MLPFTDDTAPHQISIEAYGFPMRVCATSPELLKRAEEVFPPGWRPCPPHPDHLRIGMLQEPDGTFSVYRSRTCLSTGQGFELSLVVLDGQIRGHLAANAPERIFVHSGAVAHEGRAIIFPGYSFSGKTTLTAAMVQAGATYLSDEYAVLDSGGLVHPYPKPLSVRHDPEELQIDHPVEAFNGTAADQAVPLGLAVITTYKPGASWNPRELTLGDAALALLANTVAARRRPAESMQFIRRALEGAVALEGERGEADEVAAELLEAARAA